MYAKIETINKLFYKLQVNVWLFSLQGFVMEATYSKGLVTNSERKHIIRTFVYLGFIVPERYVSTAGSI